MWRLLVVLFPLAAVMADVPVVHIAEGQLRGSIMKSVNDKDIYAFRGIPYAKPPLGDLRFKAPVPAESWEGIRNATEDGAPCMQRDVRFGQPSEDCLTLNVYTTKLSTGKGNKPRPVMVFFHPGGFFSLTGNSQFAGPQYLMDHDVVLVSGNYRLSVLGFLTMQDENLPGNYGMKDQVLFLRWVQRNIAAFGGDPSQVTIFGYSAGSSSVFLHMLSPMSQGLFHRCIAMSSSQFRQKNSKNAVQAAKKLAGLMNCPMESSKKMVQCLREKKAEELVGKLRDFTEFGFNPVVVFGPEVEPDLGNGYERFLPDIPTNLALEGKFAHVPLITGHTTLEFGWKALQILDNVTLTRQLNEEFDRIAPIIFEYERGTPKSYQVSREIRRFYFNDQPVSNDTEEEFRDLFADSLVNFGIYRAAKLLSRNNSAPVYFYRFSYPGKWSYIYYPWETNQTYGVVHHDDLIYLLWNSVKFPLMSPEDREYQMMKKMTKMWTNFVKGGNPTAEYSSLLNNVTWEPFTEENLKYLDIGETVEMKRGLYEDRIRFWESLYPLPASTN